MEQKRKTWKIENASHMQQQNRQQCGISSINIINYEEHSFFSFLELGGDSPCRIAVQSRDSVQEAQKGTYSRTCCRARGRTRGASRGHSCRWSNFPENIPTVRNVVSPSCQSAPPRVSGRCGYVSFCERIDCRHAQSSGKFLGFADRPGIQPTHCVAVLARSMLDHPKLSRSFPLPSRY